jgi:hypothetical protein
MPIFSSRKPSPTHDLEHNSATINNKIRTINITPRPTSQQHTNTIQLPHSTHPPHRVPASPALPHLLQPLTRVQNRIHIPRRNRINSNTLTRPLSSERRLERHNRRFRHIVSGLRLWEVHAVRGDRSCKRDAAVWRRVGRHVFGGCLGAEEGTSRVHVDGLAPLAVGHGDGRYAAYNSSEAEHVVERAQSGDCGGDAFLHGGGVGYVDGDAENAGAGEFGGERCYC